MVNKKISCRRETARRFVSLNILLSHSRSLKVIRNDKSVPLKLSVFRIVSEIFSVKECRDLETGGRGRSRSLNMAPFDRPNTTFYWSTIINIALSGTVFELFDVE